MNDNYAPLGVANATAPALTPHPCLPATGLCRSPDLPDLRCPPGYVHSLKSLSHLCGWTFISDRLSLTELPLPADPVQDLYLRELKAYKPIPIKPGDAEAHVQKFALPKAPPSPEEANLAGELSSYESQEVEVEGQAATGEAAPVEESWFEEDEEEASAAH